MHMARAKKTRATGKSGGSLIISDFCVRKHCKMTCSLDRYCQSSLMCSAGSCDPSGKDLSALRNILAEF